jgi:hypothetical protein
MHARLILGAVLVAARSASAAPCDAEAAAIRAHLTDEAARAHRWDLGWGIGLGTVAAGELALGLSGAFGRDQHESFYVGAAEATIGAAGHFVLPLEVEVPAPAADACADLAALRAAMTTTARHERQSFWLLHIGTLVLNGAGAIVLGERTTWTNAATSFVVGWAVGLVTIYTQPRGTWHASRALSIGALPTDGGGFAWVGGRF